MRCKARITTVEREAEHLVTSSLNEHSHAPLAHEREVVKTNFNLKQKAKDSALSPCVIVTDSVANTPEDCKMHLPSTDAQRQKIRRVRASSLKEPETLEDIQIPQHLWFVDGELFVLNESVYSTGVNILMGTRTTMEILTNSECWLVYGTFAVVSNILGQLFSVHGYLDNIVVPLIFCLVSSRSTEAYDVFWDQLKKAADDMTIVLRPRTIISDFEIAIGCTARTAFPEATTHGCLFHFGQIIWRQVQQRGLQLKFGADRSFSLEVRMLKALSFVPADEVPEYFQALVESLRHSEVRDMAKWFKSIYIGTESRAPRYSPLFWTTGSAATDRHFPRTQNSVEAWHRRLKAVVSQKHAGVYKIIADLGKEAIMSKVAVEKVRLGVLPPASRTIKKYERIERVMDNRNAMDKVDFPRNIANNVNVE